MPDIANIKSTLEALGLPAETIEVMVKAANAAGAGKKPRAEKARTIVIKEPDAPATWVQCVALYRASNGALRFWKGAEGTALTKGAASALIEAVKRQQAEGRKVFVPGLAPELNGVKIPPEEISSWAKADFRLAPAHKAEPKDEKPRAKRGKKVSKKAKASKLTLAEQIAQAIAALAK